MRRKNYPELASWLPAVKAPINDHLAQYVRALVIHAASSHPEAWASCVAVTYGGAPFLLTAKHNLDRANGRPLLLEVPGRFEPLVIDSNTVAADASADVAAIRLPHAALHWPLALLSLETQNECIGAENDYEMFIAMGFPTRKSTPNHKKARLEFAQVTYWSVEHTDAYRLLQLSAERCIATKFTPQQAYEFGMVRTMKKPHGMSGGALWRLCSPSTDVPSKDGITLAGIITEYRKSPARCMLSTRVRILTELAARTMG